MSLLYHDFLCEKLFFIIFPRITKGACMSTTNMVGELGRHYFCVYVILFLTSSCREVYAVSIVGPFPIAVTNLLDLQRL